jgi:hypothetical protein
LAELDGARIARLTLPDQTAHSLRQTHATRPAPSCGQRLAVRASQAFKKQTRKDNRSMSRIAFTGATLLGLVAFLGAFIGYYHLVVKIGEYDVPSMMGWATAAVFGLIAVLLMRFAHT